MPVQRTSIDQPPPPPTDLPGVLHVLGQVSDPAQIATALGVLLELKSLPTDGEPAAELVAKALPHSKLCHKDVRVRNACVRVLGRLIHCPGFLQSKLVSEEQYAEGAWTCLAEFSDIYGAYKEAVAQLANAPPTPEVKRGPASKLSAIPDPEAGLPGPSKHALDAALRTLALMQARGPPQVLRWLVGHQSTMTLLPLVQLLGHHSGRVKMRAAKLINMVCGSEGARLRLLQASCVAALLREASKHLSGTVRVEVVQALHHLLSCPGTQHLDLLEPGDRASQPPFDKPSNLQLEGRDGVQILLGLMVSPENGHATTVEEQMKEAKSGAYEASEVGSVQGGAAAPSVAPTSTGASAKHGKSSPSPAYLGPPPLDFGRPQRSKPEDLQLAAARALLSSCTFCASTAERLVQLGGFQLLLALLPQPPAPETEVPALTPADASTPPKEDKKGGTQGKGAPALAPALATITDLEEDSQSCSSAVYERAATEVKDLDWTTTLVSSVFEVPLLKALTTDVHVVALKLMSMLLMQPDIQATLHSHALTERAAAEARKAQAEEAAKAEAAARAESVAAAAACALPQGGVGGKGGKGSQTAAAVGAEQLPQQAQQAGGRAADNRGIVDRWGRPADAEAVRLLGTLHEVLLFSWAPQLPPPPRPTSESKKEKEAAKKTVGSASKGNKGLPEELSPQEHMLPPFGPSVRAAALECLVQLVKHEGYAALIAGSALVGAMVGRLGRSEEITILQAPADQSIRTSSPLGKGRSKAKGQTPSPPLSAGAPGSQAAVGAQPGEQPDKDGARPKQAKVAAFPEPELVAPLATLLQLLIPHLATPAPPPDNAPVAAPSKPRASKALLGQKAADAASAPLVRQMDTGLTRPDVVHALKRIAAAAHAADSQRIVGLESVQLAVASAVLMLPESEFMVEARPPLPSPPPTPPPQPLATSVFLWDALDRPQMTDGSVKLVHIV